MRNIEIWHNPRCSKSRAALAQLEAWEEKNKIQLKVRKYLENPPSIAEISQVFEFLKLESPKQWMRKGETIYGELGVAGMESSTELLTLLAKHPILIERAVVIDFQNCSALIARPPEKINEFLQIS